MLQIPQKLLHSPWSQQKGVRLTPAGVFLNLQVGSWGAARRAAFIIAASVGGALSAVLKRSLLGRTCCSRIKRSLLAQTEMCRSYSEAGTGTGGGCVDEHWKSYCVTENKRTVAFSLLSSCFALFPPTVFNRKHTFVFYCLPRGAAPPSGPARRCLTSRKGFFG